MPLPRLRSAAWQLLACCLACPLLAVTTLSAAPRKTPAPLQVSLIDQLPPQGDAPSFQGLDERRRGEIFRAALDAVSAEHKLPPVRLVNRDLSLPATVADEPPTAPGTPLLRIYLTQWSRTRLGGTADTEILCRFFVELRRDGHVEKKLGPFFARQSFDTVGTAPPQNRWTQFQQAAEQAIKKMAAALHADR